MKFQLILSASALLLSTVPAALVGATQYQYGGDIPGQGGSSGSGSSGDGTLLEGDPDLAAFSDMFVATPRGRNNNVRDSAAFRNGQQVGGRYQFQM